MASNKTSKERVGSVAVASQKKGSQEKEKPDDYSSHGVTDNDIFMLPGSDFQVMLALTALAFAVRLYKISQPTSVVFDEVQ